MKWDSIYQGGDHYKKGWNYFFATVIAKKRELWFPDEMKKRREERARQKEDQYKREMYERLRRSYESRAAGSFYRGGFNRGGFYRGESEKFDSASKEESRRKAAEEWERLWQTIINDSYFYTSSGGKRNQHFYEWNFTAKRNDELSFREAKEFMELQNYSFISPEMIKSQYRKLAKKYHPDCGGNGEDFKKLAKAKETLERGY